MLKEMPKVMPAKRAAEVLTTLNFLTRRSRIFRTFSTIILEVFRGFADAAVACRNISQERWM